MNEPRIVRRLRRIMLVLAALSCAGALLELSAVAHTGSIIQWLAFAFAGVGLAAVIVFAARPGRGTLRVLRGAGAVVIFGGVLGIYEHLEHNIEFELEIRPNDGVADVFLDGLRGANPLLAPGILALAGTLAIAATLEHPAAARPARPVS